MRWPEGWPGNDILPARAIVAADRDNRLVPFALAAMRACFREGRDITQPAEIESLAVTAGMDGPELLAKAEDLATKQALREINDEAVAAGVIGVPSVVVNGTVFWGDDRIDEAVAQARQ
jgi:2-hydroxychromene-2-carboxylate isomerase